MLRRELMLGVVAVAMLAGCALTGRTRASSVAVGVEAKAGIEISGVELEAGQTRLENVGTFAWGEYDARDLGVLQESLVASAATLGAPGDRERFGVHVIVRRFLVAHSNNEGMVVACVAWALTDPQGRLVFHEQFYASDYVRTWGTIGGIKNHVHEGITRHIVRQAALVSGGREPERPNSQYVHDSYESATAGLPSSLRSVHINTLALGGGYAVRVIEGDSQRDWARRDDHVDWQARLGDPAPVPEASSSPAAASAPDAEISEVAHRGWGPEDTVDAMP